MSIEYKFERGIEFLKAIFVYTSFLVLVFSLNIAWHLNWDNIGEVFIDLSVYGATVVVLIYSLTKFKRTSAIARYTYFFSAIYKGHVIKIKKEVSRKDLVDMLKDYSRYTIDHSPLDMDFCIVRFVHSDDALHFAMRYGDVIYA